MTNVNENLWGKQDVFNVHPKYGTGYISSYVRIYTYMGGSGNMDIETELRVADCSRSVELSVDCHNENDSKNTLFKLNMMISHLKGFRKAVKKAIKARAKHKETSEEEEDR